MPAECQMFFKNELKINPSNPGPKTVNVLHMMSQLIVLTASRTLQGKEIRENIGGSRFAKLLEDLDKGFTPLNFLFPNLPLPSYRRRDKAQKEMSEFYQSIMAKRRTGEHDHEQDMIAALQGSVYRNGTPLTDRDVAHMMVSLASL